LVLEKKQIGIFVVAAICFVLFAVLRYIPVSKDMEEITQIRTEQSRLIAKGISDQEQLEIFQEQLLKLKERLGKYESNIPKQKDLGSFLKQIAELMESNNLKDQAVQPLASVKADELICIPVNMEGRGSLSEIYQFYKKLQELDRQIRIKHVKLKNSEDFSGDIKMETEIVIYYRNQQVG